MKTIYFSHRNAICIFGFLLTIISTAKIQAQCSTNFKEDNGLLVIEAESLSVPSAWKKQSSINGASGGSYLIWTGSDNFSKPGNGLITVKFEIKTTGTYDFQWRNRIGQGNNFTEHNDTWIKFPDADDFFATKGSSRVYPKGSGKTPNPEGAGSNGWFKAYLTGSTGWTWSTSTFDFEPHKIKVRFDDPGTYTMQISGRSKSHIIDRIVLSRNQNGQSLSLKESSCNGGGNPPTSSKNEITKVSAPSSVKQGENVSVSVDYKASTNRDVIVVFQLDESPWTGYAQQKKDVSAGSGTLNFNFKIPSNTPIANNKYQFQTFITTNGGGWSQRLDNTAKINVDVTNSGGGSSGSTNLSQGTYRFQNASNNRYLDADGNGAIKLNGSNNNPDQQWGLHPTSGGFYNIDSRFNGRGLLDTDPKGVVKWSTTGPTNTKDGFQWKAIKLSNGNYRFENRVKDRKYLRYNENSNRIEYSNTADKGSEWKLTRVGGLKSSIVTEIENANISIYPNPASEAITITRTSATNAQVNIYNVNGALVRSIKTSDKNVQINNLNLISGLYIATITSDLGIKTINFIVDKQ